MSRETTPEDVGTMIKASKDKSNEPTIQQDTAIVAPNPQPKSQVFAMSSDDDFFFNHPNSVFAIFFAATPIILLALLFVLWAAQQIW